MSTESDDGTKQRPGLSGTAAAFRGGWDSAGKGKAKAPKAKAPKGKEAGGPVSSAGKLPGIDSPKPMSKGGAIRKTAVYLLHKGEYVVPAKRSKKTSRKKTITKH